MEQPIGHLMEHKLKRDKLILTGKNIFLMPIVLADCTERYLSWLQDPEINQYLETRWSPQNMQSIEQFVESMLDDPNNYLFAIRDLTTEQHIGNIKLGPI